MFKFNLEILRLHRQRLEDECQKRLAAEKLEQQKLEAALQHLEGTCGDIIEDLRNGQVATMKAEEHVRYCRYLRALRAKVDRQRELIAQAEQRCECARRELQEASRKKKTIDKLKDKKREEYDLRLNRHEQKQLDDAGIGLFSRPAYHRPGSG